MQKVSLYVVMTDLDLCYLSNSTPSYGYGVTVAFLFFEIVFQFSVFHDNLISY